VQQEPHEEKKTRRALFRAPLINVSAVKFAVQASLAVSVSSLFILFANSLLGTGGIWVTVTIVLLVEAQLGSSIRKSVQLVAGTVVGCLLGVGTIAMIGFTGPDCLLCDYKIPLYIVVLFIVTFFASYFRVHRPRYAYMYTLGLLSVIIVISGEVRYPSPSISDLWYPFWSRIAAVMIGIGISFLVLFCIFPNRSSTIVRLKLVEMIRVDMPDLFDMAFGGLLTAASQRETPNPEGVPRSRSHPHLGYSSDDRIICPREYEAIEIGETEDEEEKEEEKEKGHFEQQRQSTREVEQLLATLSLKLIGIGDILATADGEPILRGGKIEFLPTDDWRTLLFKVRSMFNTGIPLLFVLYLDASEASLGRTNQILAKYLGEITDLKQHLSVLLNNIAGYLEVCLLFCFFVNSESPG